MKLWVPDVPDPRLVDTDKEAGQWNEIMREVYEMDNYSFKGCKIEKGDVFVDVGANIGVFCRHACDRPRRTEVL